MGGIGSGNHWQHSKTTTDSTKAIDIRYMRKHGLLKPINKGSLSWKCNGEAMGYIDYQCFEDHLELNYRYRINGGDWQPMKQKIQLDETHCHYGGKRYWFRCSHCNRRVALLYCDGALFLCRHCYDLTYFSRQQSPMSRAIEQKHKLGQRIFEHYEYGEGWGKRKGMHWATFYRLLRRYDRLETEWHDQMNRYFERH